MEKASINRAITKATGLQGNFFDDLNACHEMEKALTGTQQAVYYRKALKISTGSGMFSLMHQNDRALIHATARQRCEAFLRTIGQWEEDK